MDLNDMLNEARELEQANITALPISQEKIFDFLETQKNKVLNGFSDGYKLAILLDLFSDKIAEIKNAISDVVINEVSESITYNGYRIELSKGGRYDYKNSVLWNSLNSEIKELEKNMQLASKVNGEIADVNGEIIQPAIYEVFECFFNWYFCTLF